MYNNNSYHIINIPFCYKGMNRNISSEVLPTNRTHTLENIMPLPLGEGNVRFGTRLKHKFNDLCEVLESFGYVTKEGKKQLVIYGVRWETLDVKFYKKDGSDAVNHPVVLSKNTLKIHLHEQNNFFIQSPKLKITFKQNGYHAIKPIINKVEKNEGNHYIFSFENMVVPEAIEEVITLDYQVGCLRVYDFDEEKVITGNPLLLDNIKELDIDNLSASCVPRNVIFQDRMIICNGVDRMRVWDGENITILSDYVVEHNALPSVNGKEVTLQNIKNQNKYYVGGNVKFKIDNKIYGPFKIDAVNFEQKKITLTENAPTLATTNIFYYEDFPPRFSYLYVFQHRIWALSEGAVSQNYRQHPMLVYYTDRTEQYDGWFHEDSQEVPYIDIRYKHTKVDNLEAIHSLGDNLLFIGRNQTQIWKSPTKSLEIDDYVWSSTINGGVVHGNLLLKLPNNLILVSSNGIVLMTTLNVAKQFNMQSINAVDPLARHYINSLKFSAYRYRQCRAFIYNEGAFLGFKIGNNPTLIGIFNTDIYSWTMFSGAFRKATTFNSELNQLFLFTDNELLFYGDGRNDIYCYDDNKLPIGFRWSLPVFDGSKKKHMKRFMNKRFEIDLSYPSSFVKKEQNYVSLIVSGDLPREFTKASNYQPLNKGDLLGTVRLALDEEDEEYFEFSTKEKTIKQRLRFVTNKFWSTIYGQSVNGPIKITNVKFFGSK